ncbi:hypothetical protein RFF05_04115 [Bengtsoniella intestinalis]|uniref:DUF6550 family protein n=1 Tax=Bengtsoniella intestinalis TaxID=3073143 RepID=UPI00391F654F
MKNTKKWLIIIGALIVCALLVALISQQMNGDVVEDDPLPTVTEEPTDVVVDITVPNEQKEEITITVPDISEDINQPAGAVDTGTEQTIQPDIPEKPTYTEEELSNPDQTPNSIPVEAPTEENPDPTPVENQIATENSSGGLPGFDDVPYMGENQAIYAEDMYENGNKVGIMD